ncbi:V-set and immunoglobulin domain-containing protein 1-like [Leuresthes tenuis]|uniref:V-set and immunoglobulin domain-containing protein 1-like n=1 Tax=Leuresthes tenuis TaxID=355514 RepID=UPI003B503872
MRKIFHVFLVYHEIALELQSSVVSLVSPPSDAAVEGKSSTLTSLTSLLCVVSSPAEQRIITAVAGQDVTLTYRVPNNKNIMVVQWSRTDLGEEYVLFYRDGQFDPDNQHPSFKDRVDLQMKDGNVSLILKNVMTNDTGTYECRVAHKGEKGLKTFSIILSVSPAGNQAGRREDGGEKDGDEEGGGKDGGGKGGGGKEGGGKEGGGKEGGEK